MISEKFLRPDLPEYFYWYNEPSKYSLGNGLEIFTDAKTDFWQNTLYGYQKDNGHCLLIAQDGDFSIMTHVEFQLEEKYDQCGLIVRMDAGNWIKVSVEFENEEFSRLGSVVTSLGYSDWAMQDISSSNRNMRYRINKKGNDLLIEHSFDAISWRQMRVAHLHKPAQRLEAGVYACSPFGNGFRCKFILLEINNE